MLLERVVTDRKDRAESLRQGSYFSSKTDDGRGSEEYESIALVMSDATGFACQENVKRSRQDFQAEGVAIGLIGALLESGPRYAVGTTYGPTITFEELIRIVSETFGSTSDNPSVWQVEVRAGLPSHDLPLTVDTRRAITIEQMSRGLEAAALEVPVETLLPGFNPDDYDLF